MAKCTFCGYDIEKGTGKIKIMKDGKIIHLCSMKCEKNMFKLRRIPRKIQWTAEYKAWKKMRLSPAEKAEVSAKKKTKAK